MPIGLSLRRICRQPHLTSPKAQPPTSELSHIQAKVLVNKTKHYHVLDRQYTFKLDLNDPHECRNDREGVEAFYEASTTMLASTETRG